MSLIQDYLNGTPVDSIEFQKELQKLIATKDHLKARAPPHELYFRRLEDRVKVLEAAMVECFDIAVPQAMPFPGNLSEKADYAAKVLPQLLRGVITLHAAKDKEMEELLQALEKRVRELIEP